jgi:hypothetical protein
MFARGSFRRLLWLVLVVSSAACHDPNAYIVSPSNADDILQIKVDKTSIPADGVSTTTITATITGAAASDRRELTFTATGGALISGRQEGLEVKATADVAGQVVVLLRSDTIVRTVKVDVKVQSVVRSATVDFTAPVADQTFAIATDRTVIPADGFSTANLTVTLNVVGPTASRQIDLQTSAGTLIAAGVVSGTKISVSAAANGVATAQLQSTKNAGTARITATALNVTRVLDIAFQAVSSDSIIRLATSDTSLPADGKSTARLTATIAAGLPDSKRTVRFRTTAGKFLPEGSKDVTRPADGSQQAKVDLQVDAETGFARVSAEVDSTASNDVGIQFVPALATRVILIATKTRLVSGDVSNLTASLLRDVGTVSSKTVVTFSAVDASGAPIGVFEDVRPTNDQQDATAKFNLGATTYKGTITITATAPGGASATLTFVVI